MKFNIIAFLSWVFGMVAGFISLYFFPELLFIDNDNSLVKKETLSVPNILITNLQVCLVNILGGFTFGLTTILNLIYNGFVFSFLLKLIYVVNLKYFANLLPHSCEVVGFVISGAVGLELGYFFYKTINKKHTNLNHSKIITKTFLSVSIIILFSFVEVYISTLF